MTVDVFVNRRKADEFLRRGEWPQVKAYLQSQDKLEWDIICRK